jgi:hypothetical protein
MLFQGSFLIEVDRDETVAPPAIFLPTGEYRTLIRLLGDSDNTYYGITYYFKINQ